ncbi:MAG TPA: YdeI/OmpD-associated family protein [Telluria sp.]|nr:YdeI/OmpD-associated family protein [Telluria sp.]
MEDPRIDAYIAKSADFARPILEHVRAVVHAACPDIEETMKWSMPHFVHNGIVCSMAAFKAHCAVSFWKGELVFGYPAGGGAMGHLGRITSVKDLPPKAKLIAYVKQAVKLNADGRPAPARARPAAKRPAAAVPSYLSAALERNAAARAAFDAFSPSHRREYIEWLEEAKTEPTRAKRLLQTIEWLSEGKSRNWKYARK